MISYLETQNAIKRIDQLNDFKDLRIKLVSTPDWGTLNAYEMTKRCCAELTQRGQRLPSWINIRDIIGKGSANDINRGKADFLREHGDALRKMNGFVKGVPEALAPHILGFWEAAISLVREEFNGQVAEWQVKIEQAEAAAAHAADERDQAVSRAEALQGQIAGLQEAMHTLQSRVDTERAAREQAERMFEANREELAGQRDELRAALAHSQQELSDAITRLEGVKNHSLVEIDRARTEARDSIVAIEAKARRESDAHIVEINAANVQIRDLRAQIAVLSQEKSSHEQKITMLHSMLQRAESQSDQLASEKAQLVEALKNAVEPPKRLRRVLHTRTEKSRAKKIPGA